MKTAAKLEPIEVPFSEAGRRCYEVMAQLALQKLHGAREAVEAFIKSSVPNAEIAGEKALKDGKYIASLALPGGKTKTVTYDYRTTAIELT